MKKKMKAYVLTLSVVFPVTHRRAGKYTHFKAKVLDTLTDKPIEKKVDSEKSMEVVSQSDTTITVRIKR